MCDRHPEKPAGGIFRNLQTEEEVDLCNGCMDEFKEWLQNKSKGATINKRGWRKLFS